MNINFGLFWVNQMKIKNKQERNHKIAVNAMEQIKKWMQGLGESIDSAA
jgi:folate-dependent tRNA-U54 methylase TrmFO/GidA